MKFASSCVVLFLVWVCVDSFTPGSVRDKRRFKSSVADRIGHGFGKRQDISQPRFYPTDNTRNEMTTHRLAKLLAENKLLAYAIVDKFIDTNGDGIISTDELLYGKAGNS